MKELSVGKQTVKNSIFFGHLYLIDNDKEINIILKNHKKLYSRANHHCYAINLKLESGEVYSLYKNDGEVGKPGKILLDLLKKYSLQKNVICVSRIFGGINLGVGGVSKAFKELGESLINYYISKNIHI